MCLISKACWCVLGVLYHGDLTEKLKLLYKMHVIPGESTAMQFNHLYKTTELIHLPRVITGNNEEKWLSSRNTCSSFLNSLDKSLSGLSMS